MDFTKITKIASKYSLPDKDITTITEYIDHNEWGIAFEELCSALEQEKIQISFSDYSIIKKYGELMKMDCALWNGILVDTCSTDPTIRKLTKEDADTAMALYRRVVKAMHAAGFMQWNDNYPNMEYLQKDIAAGTAFGCFMDGTLAAAGTFDGNQSPEYEAIPFQFGTPFLVVHRLAVDPDIQRQGLARRMMDYAEALARRKGFPAMRLDTCQDNTSALALYEGRGYIRRGTCHFPGRTFTFIVMEKKIDS